MTNTPEITVSASSSRAARLEGLPRSKTIKVNGVVIPRDAVAQETQNHPASKPVEAWKAAARALIVRELLLQEATRRGIQAIPLRDDEDRRETDEEASIRVLIESAVTVPSPDQVSCRRVYDANRERYRSADLYEVRHILLAAPPSDPAARSDTRVRAMAIISSLRADITTFAELAALHSDCPSAGTSGSLGQISAGQTVPEFESALAAQPIGTVGSEPIETRYGHHVVVVDRHIAGAQLPFEIVETRIREWLTTKSRHIGIRCFIMDLARQATIEGIDFDLYEG